MFLDTYDEVQLSFSIRMRIVYQGCVVLLWRRCGDGVVEILIKWSGFRSDDEVTDAFYYLLSFIYLFNFLGRIEVTTD